MESQLEVQSKFPCAFHCSSGELLFGQMQCIAEGIESNLHDGMAGPTLRPVTGTIIQNDFKYRTAARAGQWNVSRVYVGHQNGLDDHDFTEDRRLIAYVLHHVDVSPVEYVRRASMVGISIGNKHKDKEIVYVNRYDWSWNHGKRSTINAALGPDRPYTVTQIHDLMGGRLIVIDPSLAQTFINTVRNVYLHRECYSLRAIPNDIPYGIHLDCAEEGYPEYELGWLAFSGEKHLQFHESDELVAIIYDPTYHGLRNLESTEAILVENVVAIAGYELVEDKEDSDAEDVSTTDSSESSGTFSNDVIDEDELTSLRLPEGPDSMPPPSISDICHVSGLTVLISGSTLSLAKSVLFGDELASFKVNSNTQVEAYAPPGVTGLVGVKILGPGGTSNIFEYTHPAVATINSVTPDSGSRWGGNVVMISGNHLERTTDVVFGDLPAIAFEIISDTQINATAPAGFPVARYIEITLQTPYEVGKNHRYKYDLNGPGYTPVELNYDAAITTWQRAIKRDPTNWDYRHELAEVYDKKHDSMALISLWKEASHLEPKNTTALDNLAKAYAATGNFEAVIEAWQTAIQAGADEEHIFLGLANAYDKIGNIEASVEMTNEAARMYPPSK